MPNRDDQGYAAAMREVSVATASVGAAAKMVRVLENEFNRVVTTAARLGRDASGEEVRPIGERWVTIAESIYQELSDCEGTSDGVLTIEELQIFLLALLLNEVNKENKNTMPILV